MASFNTPGAKGVKVLNSGNPDRGEPLQPQREGGECQPAVHPSVGAGIRQEGHDAGQERPTQHNREAQALEQVGEEGWQARFVKAKAGFDDKRMVERKGEGQQPFPKD